MSTITTIKPFTEYGFDVEVSSCDTFNFTFAGGIYLLRVIKDDGREVVRRRMILDDEGTTCEFDIASFSKYEKELYIKRLKRLDLGNTEVAALLGLSYAYVAKIGLPQIR